MIKVRVATLTVHCPRLAWNSGSLHGISQRFPFGRRGELFIPRLEGHGCFHAMYIRRKPMQLHINSEAAQVHILESYSISTMCLARRSSMHSIGFETDRLHNLLSMTRELPSKYLGDGYCIYSHSRQSYEILRILDNPSIRAGSLRHFSSWRSLVLWISVDVM